jgi:hypothetical protein
MHLAYFDSAIFFPPLLMKYVKHIVSIPIR